MKFKFLLIVIIVFIHTIRISAQLSVDAGKDTIYCVQSYPVLDMYLGENVVIENAVEPIQIAWECELDVGISKIFTASDLLSDTTILTPKFIDFSGEWPIKFFLHVTDSLGNYAKDSINVHFSNFAYSLIEWHYDINKGDSIQMDGISYIGAGISPLSIVWTPSYGLTDSTDLATWAKPDTSIMYYQIATDAAGCVSIPHLVYIIDILPNSINDEEHEIAIWQNEAEIRISDNIQGHKHLSIYTINGTLLFSEKSTKNRFEVGSKIQNAGIYICSIAIDNKIYSLKFIKN